MASSGAVPSTSGPNDPLDDSSNKLTLYLHRLSGHLETEVDSIIQDHSYARPWNWKPENIYVKPIKKLFFPKSSPVSSEKTLQDDIQDEDEEKRKVSTSPPLDLTRTRYQMEEFQRLANFARPDDTEDWEERIDKILWTPIQNRIFTKVMKILNSERLSRLARSQDPIEPIFRRNSIDNTARRFREILASAGWDWRLVQWLHTLLFDHLPQEYLAIYFEILQIMRTKIPQLIDKMISIQTNITSKGTPITWETLGSFLKRSWDPVAPTLNANRLKKLPGNPILIIAPSVIGNTMSSRQHKWIGQLGALGTVVNVNTNLGLASNRMTMMVCVDQLVQAVRVKIQDVRSDYPGRPLVLVGLDTGAALACQIAQMEHVTAVVCLGFPFLTVEGKRGTPDDTLLDIRCPVMFVIGENSCLVRIDDLEDLREKMMVETSLVVVGSADDNLRISSYKKLSQGITQNMVDRCVLDEIGDFVGSILLQPHPLPLRSTIAANFDNKKEARKRKNSTSSSVESEPNSPTVKKSRSSTPIPTSVPSTSQPTTITTNNNSVKRKPRVTNNQKGHFVERLITSRTPGQSNIHSENGGITLNIGSLASLAPIGPIRLSATPSDNTKISMPLQTVSRMKSIVPSANKGIVKIADTTPTIAKDATSKIVEITPNCNKDKREIVVLPESLRKTRPSTPSPIIFPFKTTTTSKLMKNMPKITINPNNLHRMQNQIDEDLGNILDIPIIFAKDDDNFQQQQSTIETNLSNRLNSTTKVVLISNKQDKLINPNNNHIIVQTRMKNQINLPLRSSNQPTIKYTKIILAKRTPIRDEIVVSNKTNIPEIDLTSPKKTKD